MTDSRVKVLVPYSRFLEYRDLRHEIAAELTQRDQLPTIDGDVIPVPRATSTPATIPQEKTK